MRLRSTSVVTAVLLFMTGVGLVAAPGGAATPAKDPCTKNRWQTVTREDLTQFENRGACVSYVKRGGRVADPAAFAAAQAVCAQYGGEFLLGSGGYQHPNAIGLWRCLRFPYAQVQASTDSCLGPDVANQWLALGFTYGADPFEPETVDVLCVRSTGS